MEPAPSGLGGNLPGVYFLEDRGGRFGAAAAAPAPGRGSGKVPRITNQPAQVAAAGVVDLGSVFSGGGSTRKGGTRGLRAQGSGPHSNKPQVEAPLHLDSLAAKRDSRDGAEGASQIGFHPRKPLELAPSRRRRPEPADPIL